ncbi:hypothetical protein CQA40_04175 [Helicobacter sp. MIT 01-3238]|nr:hypothetical protein CQA40_04175 [Helicobacter sp. MIT 01-3238]
MICVSFAKKAKPKTKQAQKAQIKSNGAKRVSNKAWRSIKSARKAKSIRIKKMVWWILLVDFGGLS